MSREAHTAGPWTAVHNSWETSTVYGPNDEIVASCPISYDVTEETQDELEPVKEANARLIAAAPTVTAEGQFLLDREGVIRWSFTEIPEDGRRMFARPSTDELIEAVGRVV